MPMTIEAHGQSYTIDVDPGSHIGRRMAEEGRPFEWPLLERIHALGLRGTAVDVGANVGNHALWLDVVCGLDVVAFEPVTVAELQANIDANGLDIRVEPVALGAEPARASDRGIRKGDPDGDPTDYEDWGFNHKLDVGDGPIEIRTLDSYELDDVALIKVDVEGMEPDVLRGGTETIRRCQPVIYAEALLSSPLALVLEPLGYRRTARLKRGTPLEEWKPA
jgi:FkbM family methyltransferase